MITYVEVYFSTEGPPSYEIAEKVRRETGLSFIRGNKDLAFRWKTDEEFLEMVSKIHQAFTGTRAFLRFDTEEEIEGPVHLLAQWPPAGNTRRTDHEMRVKVDDSHT